DLKLRRVPALVDYLYRLLVADPTRGDGRGRARALGLYALDAARVQLLGLRLSRRRAREELHVRLARRCGQRRRSRGEDEVARLAPLRRALLRRARWRRGRRPLQFPLNHQPLLRLARLGLEAELHVREFARDLRARLQYVVNARHGVVDEVCLRRVARGGVRADCADGLVAARAPFRVAVDLRGGLVHDAVAVGERLHALGDGLRRVGCALHDLAAEAHLRRDEDEAVA